MRGKLTIVIAVLEAVVLLVMKLCDWKESKKQKPTAGKARTVDGHRVVNPAPTEYDDEPSRGEINAAYLPASGSSADKTLHQKD